MTEEATRAELVDDALDTLDWRGDDDGRAGRAAALQAARAAAHRRARPARLRAARRRSGASSSHLADACLEAALQSLEPPLPFAVIGLGRLGGCELSYASDIDVCSCTTATTRRRLRRGRAPRDAARAAIGETHRRRRDVPRRRAAAAGGQPGPAGPFARRLPHVLRAVGPDVGVPGAHQGARRRRRCRASARASSSSRTRSCTATRCPRTGAREIRRMKARIERERIPPGEDPQFHLKLGRGSLSDIEFTVQLEQLAHGAARIPRSARRRRSARCDALVAIDAIDRRRRRRCSVPRTSCANGRATTAIS